MRCGVQAAAFAVEGHPIAAYNGTYRPRGQHEGWPRFENEHGRHLFRNRPTEWWLCRVHRGGGGPHPYRGAAMAVRGGWQA